jgi:hypothetical protein
VDSREDSLDIEEKRPTNEEAFKHFHPQRAKVTAIVIVYSTPQNVIVLLHHFLVSVRYIVGDCPTIEKVFLLEFQTHNRNISRIAQCYKLGTVSFRIDLRNLAGTCRKTGSANVRCRPHVWLELCDVSSCPILWVSVI